MENSHNHTPAFQCRDCGRGFEDRPRLNLLAVLILVVSCSVVAFNLGTQYARTRSSQAPRGKAYPVRLAGNLPTNRTVDVLVEEYTIEVLGGEPETGGRDELIKDGSRAKFATCRQFLDLRRQDYSWSPSLDLDNADKNLFSHCMPLWLLGSATTSQVSFLHDFNLVENGEELLALLARRLGGTVLSAETSWVTYAFMHLDTDAPGLDTPVFLLGWGDIDGDHVEDMVFDVVENGQDVFFVVTKESKDDPLRVVEEIRMDTYVQYLKRESLSLAEPTG